jgi:hypothetical protein
MGLFSKSGRASSTAEQRVPALGSGLQLTSTLDIHPSLRSLDRALLSFRPPKYRYLPSFVHPGWEWRGKDIPTPTTVVSFDDRVDDFVLAAFWPMTQGAVIGLFRLGSSEERLHELSASILSDWKSQDPSLVSAGLFDSGMIALAPPVLPADFLDEILTTYGFSPTPKNLAALANLILQMFVMKASEFIGSKDRRAADIFINDHVPRGVISLALLQATLDDLARWNYQVLPYIQELPMRVRAIVLDGQGLAGICE